VNFILNASSEGSENVLTDIPEKHSGYSRMALADIDLGRHPAAYCESRSTLSAMVAGRRTSIRWVARVRARDLYKLLGTQASGSAIRDAIAPAMPAYRRALAERDRSAPIVVECDGALLVLAASHIATLCEAFLAEELDAEELEYVATALERASDFHFVSQEVEECTFFLSSSEANGPASSETVGAVLRVLREHVA
jgi:hypothetical protein